jgi:protein-L-isoaspartate(D-aspartate) O-methyltransferase
VDEGKREDERESQRGRVGEGRRTRALRRHLVTLLRMEGAIRTDEVATAFRAVPRHLFVPEVSPAAAYADAVVPTRFDDAGETISALSQPTIVAVMLEQLAPGPGMHVLEIGAGTGYNAALLARLVGPRGRVVSVDVDTDIVEEARRHLRDAGGEYGNVDVVLGDGVLGRPQDEPFDRIIATVGAGDVPAAWLAQLAADGRLVVPLRIRGAVTRSVAFARAGGRAHAGIWEAVAPEPCSFMPLRGIADDNAQTLALTPDGLVTVQVYREQRVDPAALVRVLADDPVAECFTGVRFAQDESFADLDLYLTGAVPSGLCRMTLAGSAVDVWALRPQFAWGAMCTVRDASLAYLTLRQDTADLEAGRWEVGVVGHGPSGRELCVEVAECVRVWDADLRGRSARIRLAQGGDRERLTGRCVVDKPGSRVVLDWV